MNLCPEVSLILIVHAISGIIRAAFEEVKYSPNTVLVIIGKTGMLKSHYVVSAVGVSCSLQAYPTCCASAFKIYGSSLL